MFGNVRVWIQYSFLSNNKTLHLSWCMNIKFILIIIFLWLMLLRFYSCGNVSGIIRDQSSLNNAPFWLKPLHSIQRGIIWGLWFKQIYQYMWKKRKRLSRVFYYIVFMLVNCAILTYDMMITLIKTPLQEYRMDYPGSMFLCFGK